MKIIAVVSDSIYGGRYIAEVSQAEIDAISGNEVRCIRVDTQIQVCESWNRTRRIFEAQSNLDHYATGLRAIADLLGTIQVVIPPAEEVKP